MFIFNFQFVFMTIYIFLFLSDIDINDATGYIVDAQCFQNLAISSADSVTSRRNWGWCFQLGSGLLSSIPANFFCWFVLFFKLLASSFYLFKLFFWTEHKEAHCLLEKFIRQQHFFSLLHFWGHFWAPMFECYHV